MSRIYALQAITASQAQQYHYVCSLERLVALNRLVPACPILTRCPEGTKSERQNYGVIIFTTFTILALYAIYYFSMRYRDKKREERHTKRMASKNQAAVPLLAMNDEDAVSTRSSRATPLKAKEFVIDVRLGGVTAVAHCVVLPVFI